MGVLTLIDLLPLAQGCQIFKVPPVVDGIERLLVVDQERLSRAKQGSNRLAELHRSLAE